MMDTITILKCLEQLPKSGVSNVGVYASDRLPTRISPSTAIVVNTKPQTDSGEHWVAFYWDQNSNRIEFFDSFGRAPYPSDYQQFLRRNSRVPFVFNKYRLQGYSTSVCGHYCLSYLYFRVVYGISMNDFVHCFDVSQQHTSANDALVRQLFKTLYHLK